MIVKYSLISGDPIMGTGLSNRRGIPSKGSNTGAFRGLRLRALAQPRKVALARAQAPNTLTWETLGTLSCTYSLFVFIGTYYLRYVLCHTDLTYRWTDRCNAHQRRDIPDHMTSRWHWHPRASGIGGSHCLGWTYVRHGPSQCTHESRSVMWCR